MMMRISRFYSGIERSPREGIYWAFALLAVLLLNPARAIENESLSIRLNTIGYLPGTEKQAAIAAICTNFTVLRLADNATVFTGKVTSPALDSDTPEQLCTADFS
jgi:endoglucanase